MTEIAATFALCCTTTDTSSQRWPGGHLHTPAAVCVTPQHTLPLSLKPEVSDAPGEDAGLNTSSRKRLMQFTYAASLTGA